MVFILITFLLVFSNTLGMEDTKQQNIQKNYYDNWVSLKSLAIIKGLNRKEALEYFDEQNRKVELNGNVFEVVKMIAPYFMQLPPDLKYEIAKYVAAYKYYQSYTFTVWNPNYIKYDKEVLKHPFLASTFKVNDKVINIYDQNGFFETALKPPLSENKQVIIEGIDGVQIGGINSEMPECGIYTSQHMGIYSSKDELSCMTFPTTNYEFLCNQACKAVAQDDFDLTAMLVWAYDPKYPEKLKKSGHQNPKKIKELDNSTKKPGKIKKIKNYLLDNPFKKK